MLKTVSESGRATFSCVPKPARTVGKSPDERLKLIRERVGSIVQIHCDFLQGEVFLPNPAKHTDLVEIVRIGEAEKTGWQYATRENSVDFFDRPATETDSGHRDSVIVVSEKPLDRNVGVFFAPADCAIVGFAHRDPEIDFAALVHSGWRGTAKDVIGKTLEAVKSIFGAAVTKDLEAFVSPHAMSCCYEFGVDDFRTHFMEGKFESESAGRSSEKPLWRKVRAPHNYGLVSRD